MNAQHIGQAVDVGGQLQCPPDALGGHPGDADELLGADRGRQIRVVARPRAHRDAEREVQQVHLQTHLVGDAHQRRVREGAEVHIRQQRSGIVGLTFAVGVDRCQFPGGCFRRGDNRKGRNRFRLRIRLVDDDRPRAMRLPVDRRARGPMDGTHLRVRVGGHRGRVEGGVLDVVAHALDVVRSHRFHVEQCAAVVEVELAVPAVVHGVAEVHELRRRADIELQALEDGDDVVAFVAQGFLHAPGVERAGAGPLFDRDLQHLRTPERLDAPSHSGPVDQLADQQEFGYQNGQLSAGQRGKTTLRLAHSSKPSPDPSGVLQCPAWLIWRRSRKSNA